jgi:hypothetical protein
MNDQEVILNLWYVRDEEGIIYSSSELIEELDRVVTEIENIATKH